MLKCSAMYVGGLRAYNQGVSGARTWNATQGTMLSYTVKATMTNQKTHAENNPQCCRKKPTEQACHRQVLIGSTTLFDHV